MLTCFARLTIEVLHFEDTRSTLRRCTLEFRRVNLNESLRVEMVTEELTHAR